VPRAGQHSQRYRERAWDTRVGTVELQIPKLRQGSYFPDWLLQPRRRPGGPGSRAGACTGLLKPLGHPGVDDGAPCQTVIAICFHGVQSRPLVPELLRSRSASVALWLAGFVRVHNFVWNEAPLALADGHLPANDDVVGLTVR